MCLDTVGEQLVGVYGVATISRLFKIIGLFCRISSLLYGSFAKETCNSKEPSNRSHPIPLLASSRSLSICLRADVSVLQCIAVYCSVLQCAASA